MPPTWKRGTHGCEDTDVQDVDGLAEAAGTAGPTVRPPPADPALEEGALQGAESKQEPGR